MNDFNSVKKASEYSRPLDAPVKSPQSIQIALFSAFRAFYLAFGVKAGIRLLLLLFSKQIRNSSRLRQRELLRHALFGTAVFRLAAFVGGTVGVYRILRPHGKTKARPLVSAAAAGVAAGAALAFEDGETRFVYAQQAASRAAQALHSNYVFQTGQPKDAFSERVRLVLRRAADVALFSITSGQIMYVFSMHTDKVPRDFIDFMSKMSGWSKEQLKKNAIHMRLHGCGLPCAITHPSTQSCTKHTLLVGKRVFKQILPIYFALHLVPIVVLKHKQLRTHPKTSIARLFRNTCMSGLFLAVFVASFQAMSCSQQRLFLIGIRGPWLYFVFGAISGAVSVVLEGKKRRCELALYTLPKSIQLVYRVMQAKKIVPRSTALAEIAVFSASLGVLMHFYEASKNTNSQSGAIANRGVSRMVARVFDRFF